MDVGQQVQFARARLTQPTLTERLVALILYGISCETPTRSHSVCADHSPPEQDTTIMDQGRGPGIAQDDTSLLQHVGGQFGPRDAVAKGDHIAQPNSYLVHALTSHSRKSRDAVRTRSSVERTYEWSIVDCQPVPMKRPSPSSILLHNGQADSTGKGSEVGMTPAQHWQSETFKAEPWNGLEQVSSMAMQPPRLPTLLR